MISANELIADFLDKDTVTALSQFLEKAEKWEKSADKIAAAFGASSGFSKIDDGKAKKLTQSLMSFQLKLQLTGRKSIRIFWN